ncbi:MAG: sugar nucleotide-binding protein [Candidatus Omnitrophica bacterium]|jgi:dTDP-4-dehydrorhamnose reductase|nr:sugar nucleotide-binding protein [Candidatus Omnitrophota bacterium]
MRKKALIIGNGYIGKRLQDALDCPISDKRISCYQDIAQELARYKPDVLINCIGKVGRNVDQCELDIDQTLSANTFVPLILAEAAVRHKVKLVHISSGCIFHYDYKKNIPITENRPPDFLDLFYSRSKIYSENALFALMKQFPFLVLRIRVPLDNIPDPRNLLTKLIGYRKAIDLPNSVTYIPDFLQAVKHLIMRKCNGVYNVVNRGALCYPDLLDEYRKYFPEFQYEKVKFKSLGLVRTNLVLSCRKLESTGFKMRQIKAVLPECVREYVHGA